jgi:non-ribosomal peptide synthetase component F
MRETSVAQAIRQAAHTFPDSPAVQTPSGTLTYRELGASAERLADRLGRIIGPRGFVGIDGTRGAGAIVAIVASLWAERPFVVVDPRDSESTTRAKLSALHVEAMTTYGAGLGEVEVVPPPARSRQAVTDPPPGCAETLREIEEQVAYAVFTSGSTNEPKCVLVAAGPLAPMVADHVRRLEVGTGCRTLQFARLTFDGCITEILWTLTSGACLVVVGEDALIPGTELAATLETYRVTHLKTTPFALTETRPPAGSALVHVVNGGGPCRQAVVERWSAVAAFHNAYGLTETTVCNLLTPPLDPAACRAGVPLGELVGDCDYELVGQGAGGDIVRGELVIRGRSVAIGYLTDTGVARFRDAGGGPVYRTGDIVERRGDELYYVERADRRLKVRGYRIDPGEIEVAACRLPSVREAVVTAEPARSGEDDGGSAGSSEVLSCYYVGDAGPRELREHLESVVELYKVPSVVKRVERMPYTANGKVDRDALRAGRVRTAAEPAGRTTREQVLDLVCELTGVEDVRAEDNFFAIGGDSATTLLLVGKLRELGWADAGVRDVLRAENLGVLVDRMPAGTV